MGEPVPVQLADGSLYLVPGQIAAHSALLSALAADGESQCVACPHAYTRRVLDRAVDRLRALNALDAWLRRVRTAASREELPPLLEGREAWAALQMKEDDDVLDALAWLSPRSSVESLVDPDSLERAFLETGGVVTPMQAVEEGSIGRLKLLQRIGELRVNEAVTWTSPKHAQPRKQLLLIAAASRGQEEICALLLDAGADVNAYNGGGGQTALHAAARCGSAPVCRLLLERGATPDAVDSRNWTALHAAAARGDAALCELLLDFGADVRQRDSLQDTPLLKAARFGHAALCELLISRGASLDEADHSGATALHLAAQQGHLPACQSLLRLGADEETKDKAGLTPRELAVEPAVVLLLNGTISDE